MPFDTGLREAKGGDLEGTGGAAGLGTTHANKVSQQNGSSHISALSFALTSHSLIPLPRIFWPQVITFLFLVIHTCSNTSCPDTLGLTLYLKQQPNPNFLFCFIFLLTIAA